MKNYSIYFCFLMTALIYSCNSGSQSSVFKSDYIEWKNEITDSMVSHFPKTVDESVLSYGSSKTSSPEKIKYLTLLKKITKSDTFLNIEFNPDSCTFKIYFNKNVYGFNYAKHGKCKEFIPVPANELILLSKELPNDIKYHVIETSKKTFYNHEGYQRTYLPKGWENGMTRGFGISEKESLIFYWLVMW